MDYTDDYINAFRQACDRLNLRGNDLVRSLGNEQIRDNINGIGSAGMPSALRNALDSLHPSLVYASHIHDLQWTFRPVTNIEHFRETNADFEANGIMLAKDMYGWWRPARYLAEHSAKKFRCILNTWGYDNYKSTPMQEI